MNEKHISHLSGNAPVPIQCASETDATEALLRMELKEGHNHISRNAAGLELLVRTRSGRNIEYVILDSTGKPLEEQTHVIVVNRTEKKTTCWECGKDANGNTHCWKIPCPVIVGPWEPGKVLSVSFRFL